MASTKTSVTIRKDRASVTLYATGNPLRVEIGPTWRGDRMKGATTFGTLAHMDELLAAGWTAQPGEVEAFRAAVAGGLTDDPFAGVSD